MKKIKNKKFSAIDKAHPFYFAIPVCVIFLIFWLVPIILNFGYSFTNWNIYTYEINFIGLENFKKLFGEIRFFNALKNSILFTIAGTIIQNLFAFALALALYKKTRLNQLFRAIFFAPCVIGIIVWGLLFGTILHPKGLLNRILSIIFNTDVSIIWLGSTKYTLFVVVLVTVWIWLGFMTMIYVTSINSIPQEIIEAARIDGISYFGMVKNIIIPLIIPALTISMTLTIIGGLKVFDIIITLTKAGPGYATDVFNTLIYTKFSQGHLGYAAALNLFLIIFIAAVAYPIYIKLSNKVVEA